MFITCNLPQRHSKIQNEYQNLYYEANILPCNTPNATCNTFSAYTLVFDVLQIRPTFQPYALHIPVVVSVEEVMFD